MKKIKKSSFVEGTIIATLAIIVTKILGILYVIPFYKMAGLKGSTLYSYAYNIYQIFLNISTSGIPLAISKIIKEYDELNYKEAKIRAFTLGKKIITTLSSFAFLILFLFSKEIAYLILDNIKGGNTIEDVSFVIKCISFAILVIPYLSISRGFLQGHNIITPSSISQVLEQFIRIVIILIASYLTIYLFKLDITYSIGISLTGAFFGGLVSYLYIKRVINNSKLNVSYKKKDLINSKDIIKKIIKYSIPFVIINVSSSIYNSTNMILLLRGLNYFKYDAKTLELITSMVITWSPKINMIITSLSTGMVINLIPSIVVSYIKNDYKSVNKTLNKAISIIFVISLPLTIMISLLSKPIWTIFYGVSYYGPLILCINIFNALFQNLNMICISTCQALNKFKLVYLTTLFGYIMDILLIFPLMYIFYLLKLDIFYGSIISLSISYILSFSIVLLYLKKKNNFNYLEIKKILKKMILPICIMVISIITFKYLMNINLSKRIYSLIYLLIIIPISGLIFLLVSYKNNLLNSLFDISKITKKLKHIK